MSLDLIHPSIRSQVYLGSVVTGLAAASFFRRDLPEFIKIIAAMTFSGVVATLGSYNLASLVYIREKIEYLTFKEGVGEGSIEENRYIRNNIPIINDILLSVRWAPVFALAGGVLACAAKAPIPGLTKTVDTNDIKYFRLFIQVAVPLFSFADSQKMLALRSSHSEEEKMGRCKAFKTHVETGRIAWCLIVGIISPIGILVSRVNASLR